jgi:hypothetical protein
MELSTKGLNYDIKILLAWGESISGNMKITEWLTKNGFPELGLFFYALRNEERSRTWLMENKFPHLLALINGIEGNERALEWLKKHDYQLLHEMALIGDGDDGAFERLAKNNRRVFALLAKKMELVKDEIEENKKDFHKFNSSPF